MCRLKKTNLRKANILFFPLKFYTAMIVFSLVVFAFGPWPWPTRDSWELYAYMVCAVVSIRIGYLKGIKIEPGGYYGKLSPIILFRISLLLTLALFYPTLNWRTGGNISTIIDLFMHPAAAYLRSHDSQNFSGTAWVEYIRIILSVFLFLLLPLLIVYWEKLNKCEKIFGIFAVFLNIFLWLSVGTNKGIGDIAIMIFWALIIKNHKNLSFNRILKITILFLPFLILFLTFFVQGQIDRHDGVGVQDINYSVGIQADRNNIFIEKLPTIVQDGVIAFTTYLVQGYHGLVLSFNEPFVPTFGFGNSRIVTTYADKYLGTNVELNTYPARVEKSTGWDSKIQWHTIFPWLASDFTFTGAILIIGIFSYMLALSWADSLFSRNPFALSIFLQLIIAFTYISANNQALQSGEGYFGFVFTTLFWLYTRKNIKIVW